MILDGRMVFLHIPGLPICNIVYVFITTDSTCDRITVTGDQGMAFTQFSKEGNSHTFYAVTASVDLAKIEPIRARSDKRGEGAFLVRRRVEFSEEKMRRILRGDA